MIIISRMYKNHTHYVWIVFNECVRVGQTLFSIETTAALRICFVGECSIHGHNAVSTT
jgi:hypothetical protein